MNYQQIRVKIEAAIRSGNLNHDWFQENFTLEERIALFNSSTYFAEKAPFMFTEEEVLNNATAFSDYYFIHAFQILSDENKLRYLFQIQNQPGVGDTILTLASSIKSDDYKLEAVRLLKNKDDKESLVEMLESDEKKQEVLPSFHGYLRATIIASMKSDEIKEKYIHLSFNVDTIIASLESDDLRERYLRRYQLFLSLDAKAYIVRSFHDDEKKIFYLTMFKKEEDRAYVIQSLSSKRAAEFLPTIVQEENRRIIIDRLEEADLLAILPTLDKEEAYSRIISLPRDRQKIPFLKNYDQEQVAWILGTFKDTALFLENVSLIQDFEKMESLIAHREKFPPYFESYKPLIEMFAEHYQVPFEHLEEMIQLTSMQCLSYLKNENVLKILHLPDEEFKQMISFFMEENTQLSNNTFNDILNSLLQRQFRIVNPSLVNIFSQCLTAIEGKDVETLGNLLKQIAEKYPLDSFYSSHQTNQQDFLHALLEGQKQAKDLLHEITEKYLIIERSNYAKENLEEMRVNCLHNCFEKTALIKEAMKRITWAQLTEYVGSLSRQFFTSEDLQLIDNEELLREVFQFKQDPATYDKKVTNEMKQAFKAYQHIFRIFADRKFLQGCAQYIPVPTYQLPDKDPQFLLSVLGELNVDHLLEFSKNNPEHYAKMVEMLKKYQFMAWGESFSSFLEGIDLYFDPSTVASLMNNFSEFYPRLEKSGERISITGLIDQANCYGSDSYRYSQILGKEDYQLLGANPGPNSASMKRTKRLEIALEKVKKLYQRTSIPVPPIQKEYTLPNGKSLLVEVGNVTDMRNLTLGERTGACMRIGGAGESLFNFCLEDPNGFHITFSDPETGQLVSRVSGFQNGNCCCLNQLRDSLSGKYINTDLIAICKQVAADFLETSKQTSHPIDFVIISSGYAMERSNEKERDLRVPDIKKGLADFYSDVHSTAIVLAERKGNRIQLGREKVEAYEPVRSYPKKYDGENARVALQHMESLRQHLNGVPLDEIKISDFQNVETCYIGSDWYVALLSNGETLSVMFEQGDSKRAQVEMAEALQKLEMERTYQGGYQR